MPDPRPDDLPRPYLTVETSSPKKVIISNKGNAPAWNCHLRLYRKKALLPGVIGKPLADLKAVKFTHQMTVLPGTSHEIVCKRLRAAPPFHFTFVAVVSDPLADPRQVDTVQNNHRQVTIIHEWTPP